MRFRSLRWRIASFYALLLLGEWPGPWTLMGGALIVVAGVLVVIFGQHEEQVVPSLEPAP